MNLTGRCCEQGWGSPKDPEAAAHWYRLSAEGGYFRGQFNHASVLIAQGRRDEARTWLLAAIAQAPAASRSLMIVAGVNAWGLDGIAPTA
jgi:hypothetical protein